MLRQMPACLQHNTTRRSNAGRRRRSWQRPSTIDIIASIIRSPSAMSRKFPSPSSASKICNAVTHERARGVSCMHAQKSAPIGSDPHGTGRPARRKGELEAEGATTRCGVRAVC
jgi:hypothetical protein